MGEGYVESLGSSPMRQGMPAAATGLPYLKHGDLNVAMLKRGCIYLQLYPFHRDVNYGQKKIDYGTCFKWKR